MSTTPIKYLGKPTDKKVTTTWVLNKDANAQLAWDIRQFCERNGMTVKRLDANHLQVTGLLSQHEVIHKTTIEKYHHITKGVNFRAPKDNNNIIPNLPKTINTGVVNVLGLNTAPIAHPRIVYPKTNIGIPHTLQNRYLSSFTPLQLASLYHFPAADGTGQKIGVIELGGGFTNGELVTYLGSLGISTTPNVTAVSVDGAVNNPNDNSGASVEVLLDVEIIMALVPKAAIRVYFGPNTDQGFYDAILTAYNDGCKIISISWGAAEQYWANNVLTTYNALFQTLATNGVTVFAAAGDNGSSDGAAGNNVDFPASSPYVVGCGGTRLVSNGAIISQEAVWNNNSLTSATGGGISRVFAKPDYQNNVGYSLGNHRGVPDVAGNADPNTGYSIYVNGQTMVVGGTSAVSPLWSGLLARINQINGNNAGFIQPKIYTTPSACVDITLGSNGSFSAQLGWDPCTGNGRPNGASLQLLFADISVPVAPVPVAAWMATPQSGSAPLTVTFTDKSTGSPTFWLWNFGDGGTSTLQNPSHTYTNAGNYTVLLRVSNASGNNTWTGVVTIHGSPLPTAYFIAVPLSGRRPLTVNFVNSSSNATSYQWDFGDGKTSTVKDPIHIYTSPGTYSVSLTATNSRGSKKMVRKAYIFVM